MLGSVKSFAEASRADLGAGDPALGVTAQFHVHRIYIVEIVIY